MKRVLTAAVLAPLIVWVVVWGPQAAFWAVVAAVALLCYYEWAGIVAAYGIERPGPIGYAAGLILLFAERDPVLLLVVVALLALAMSLGAANLAKALPRAAALLLGVVYIFGAFRFAIPLRAHSPYWLLFALAVAWVGDMAAYYVGRAIGRHKLAPRVSPGKSWEGAAASVAGSVVFGMLFLPRLLPAVSPLAAVGFAVAANVAGQIGDLAESALKRGAGLKDSGAMLPGHGGWLDRVDSTLFTLPVVWWLVAWWGI